MNLRPDLTSQLIDTARFTARREQDLVVISYAHLLPEHTREHFEFFRGVTTTPHFKAMIDAMCRVVDYYPAKPKDVGL